MTHFDYTKPARTKGSKTKVVIVYVLSNPAPGSYPCLGYMQGEDGQTSDSWNLDGTYIHGEESSMDLENYEE